MFVQWSSRAKVKTEFWNSFLGSWPRGPDCPSLYSLSVSREGVMGQQGKEICPGLSLTFDTMPTPVRCFVCECMGGVRSLSWRRIEILSYANVKENIPFVTAVSCYCVHSNHTCLICLCFRGHISSYVNTCINRQTAWVIILEVHWTLASLFHTNPRFTSLRKKKPCQ
jgi:hypothetical protein